MVNPIEATRCERCGSADVRSDQVWGEEFLSLGECRRCAWRWTRPLRRTLRRAPTAAELALAEQETIAA